MVQLITPCSFNDIEPNREYLVFGAGQAARRTLYICQVFKLRVRAVVSATPCNFASLRVLREDELKAGDAILLASDYADEIFARLTGLDGLLVLNVSNIVQQYFERYIDVWRGKRSAGRNPFELNIYRNLLETLLRIDKKTDYSDRGAPPMGLRWYARHDIDTVPCVENYGQICDLELDLGLKVDTFIRVDALDYDPKSMKQIVDTYSSKGIEFGLHTTCYLHEDYENALVQELKLFEDCYGFTPKGLTFHGLGQLHRVRRDAAEHFLRVRYKDLGLTYADVPGVQVHWHHVLQDCNLAGVGDLRELDLAWFNAEFFQDKPVDILVLTHPCYWKS